MDAQIESHSRGCCTVLKIPNSPLANGICFLEQQHLARRVLLSFQLKACTWPECSSQGRLDLRKAASDGFALDWRQIANALTDTN